ncbi:MAG: CHAT domain-containing tetratricopeptide repeat protein [Sphingomonas sp.]|uniref:CHAT domain-containing tetratricopeptide repeat protein n=1 Tax=Sphingomonas sp. TaxID=28214 RepID=UPI003566A47C
MIRFGSGRGAALALVMLATPLAAQTVAPDKVARLETMKKAADALDEGADPAAYRKAWDAVVAYAASIYPAGHPEIAAAEGELVTADYLQGDIKGALTRSRDLIARLKLGGPAYATRVTDLMNGEFVILMTLGRHDEARIVGAEVLERRTAQYAGRAHVEVGAAYSNYANAEFEFGNYDRAIELSRRAVAEAKRLQPIPPNAALWMSNLPIYLGAAGRIEEAIEAARTTATDMEAILPPGHPFLSADLNTLARLQLQLGRASEAETTARRAVDMAVARFGEKQQTANYMSTLATALLNQGKVEEGRTVAEAAVRILAKDLGAEADRTLIARETVAAAQAASGDRAGALATQREVAEIRARKFPPHHRDRIGGGDRMAVQALKLGAIADARTAQAEAQRLRHLILPPEDISTLVGEARLGAIEVRGGDAAGGLARARAAALAVDGRLRQLLATGSYRTGQDLDARSAYGWALDAALGANDPDLAFRLAQRVTMNSAGRAASEAAARSGATDPAFATLLRDRQDSAIELERLLDRQVRLAGRGADAAAVEQMAVERRTLAARLEQRTAALRARAPDFVASELADPLSLAAVQAGLGKDEALFVAAVGEQRTGLFLVTRDRVTMASGEQGGEAINREVARLRASLAPDATAPFDFASSGRLHAILFPKAIGAAMAGKRRVLIAANAGLGALPFAALAPARAGQSLRTTRWLVRDHALVTLPSIAAVTAKRETAPQGRPAQFVAIGAPLLAAPATGGAPAFRSAGMAREVQELPALPATEPELRALGIALDAREQRVLTGAGATEAAIRALDFGHAGVVAFATHGLVAGELDGLEEPALVVTPGGDDDGLLTASEIMKLRIDAAWVVLSACNTAAGGSADDGGLTGLARAFLHAGGRNLLVSHWAVRDDAAAYLSVETVKRYGAGADPAEALRRAMLGMIDGKPVAGSDQPVNWAPFVFVGR